MVKWAGGALKNCKKRSRALFSFERSRDPCAGRSAAVGQCELLPDAGLLIESLFIESLLVASVPVDELFLVFLCFIGAPVFFMLSLDMLLALLALFEPLSFCIELLCIALPVAGVVWLGAVDCAKAAPVASRQPSASEAVIVLLVRMFISSSMSEDARKLTMQRGRGRVPNDVRKGIRQLAACAY